jgi:DNA repair protein RadA/Sms
LLAGQPGIGKSTLALQVALSRASIGSNTLYLLTEQSPEEARARAEGLLASQGRSAKSKELLRHIRFDDSLSSMENLPRIWARGKRWASDSGGELQLLVLDSAQGRGLSGNATREYKLLLNFSKELKDEGTASILLSHITKDGSIAGPKFLEHHVDCVLVLRKAMSYRPLFVTKNRFGRTPDRPVPLILDKANMGLRPSPYRDAMVAVARAIVPDVGDIVEAQVNLSLPNGLGQTGSIQSVGVPKKIIQQLISSTARFVDPDLADLNFSIQCNVPGAVRYSQYIALAMAVAITGSYVRRDIPRNYYFIGEVDLQGDIRPLSNDLFLVSGWGKAPIFRSLNLLDEDAFLFCPLGSGKLLRPERIQVGHDVTCVECQSVTDVIARVFPSDSEASGARPVKARRQTRRAAPG